MKVRFSVLQIPLRSGWSLELRRRGNDGLPSAHPLLPSGWAGSVDASGPIGFRRTPRGPSVSLSETVPIVWELFSTDLSAGGPTPIVEPHELFQITSRPGRPPHGDFTGVNRLGLVELNIRFGGDRIRRIFEVVSAKFSHERDFERMTSDIAARCQQLLLEWNTPAGLPFVSDPERRKTLLLEQFLFLTSALDCGRLERWVESIRNHVHSRLEREAAWRSSALVRSNEFMNNPTALCRDWRRSGSGELKPGSVLDVRKREDLDTPPNRFLKHALEGFDAICREVVRLFPPDGGPARTGALDLSARISAILGRPLFREVSAPRRLALENQTLQKREGYRDLLRVWLLLEQAARLEWDGRADVFNATARDVAALYEYWLFFELLTILRSHPHISEIRWAGGESGPLPVFCERDGRLRINLRRGRASVLLMECHTPGRDPLRVHFYFDRSYSPSGSILAAGAYSRPFRPDFSLVIFPASDAESAGPVEAEQIAESNGRIAYLHFDAKYRVDSLKDLFGSGEENDLREEEAAKATNTYKRADLFKMHAYNDAIRRTVGSYVLYPGHGPAATPFRKYHEILPGVGAFSISPGDPERHAALSGFIHDVFESQSDRFSQLARVRYWTHDTVKESPPDYQTFGFGVGHPAPPRDTPVLLGYLRPDEDPLHYREGVCFFVMRSNGMADADPARRHR